MVEGCSSQPLQAGLEACLVHLSSPTFAYRTMLLAVRLLLRCPLLIVTVRVCVLGNGAFVYSYLFSSLQSFLLSKAHSEWPV